MNIVFFTSASSSVELSSGTLCDKLGVSICDRIKDVATPSAHRNRKLVSRAAVFAFGQVSRILTIRMHAKIAQGSF
jgi:hypothetical protein